MSEPFKVAVAGPSRVGKTTLVTAILADTEDMLAGTPVSVIPEEKTASKLRRQKLDLASAIAAGVFNAAALGGNQELSRYDVLLQADSDLGIEVPFSILDYPGGWLNPDNRPAEWMLCEEHFKQSVMLLLPIDAAVLMEAASESQRRAVPHLLGIVDVEEIAGKWAKSRAGRPDEPAVVVLAPLKCEKYFDDNGGTGKESPRLEQEVIKAYQSVLDRIRKETRGRGLRVVYAPIDTYGCVQLMEAEWIEELPGKLEFMGRYRFRSRSPRIQVKAAGTVMQELCKCLVEGEVQRAKEGIAAQQKTYFSLVERRAESKGFRGSLAFYLSGEAWRNSKSRNLSQREIIEATRQQGQLEDALKKIAAAPQDSRVREW
jgi:GTPase SAR1 family protein